MSGLELERISQASAEQRRGRAGRTAPGVCIACGANRRRPRSVPGPRPRSSRPTSRRSRSSSRAGARSMRERCAGWIRRPRCRWRRHASCFTGSRRSTTQDARHRSGGRMSALGLHPRLAHMVVRAGSVGQTRLAVEIAALLSERDPLRAAPGARDPDIRVTHRPAARRAAARRDGPRSRRAAADSPIGRAPRARAGAPEREPRRGSDSTQELDPADAVALLLAFAYPDRIGRAREGAGGRYLLSGGRGAVFAGPTALARSEYIVVAALDLGEREARIELAAPLDMRVARRALRGRHRRARYRQLGCALRGGDRASPGASGRAAAPRRSAGRSGRAFGARRAARRHPYARAAARCPGGRSLRNGGRASPLRVSRNPTARGPTSRTRP